MCTVSYIPTKTGFILTSNRDERKNRQTSVSEVTLELYNQKITFPKDLEAGGTWIATTENRTVCLLNGAFTAHIKKENYRKSRGILLLESFQYKNTEDFLAQFDFTNIEAFTLIIITQKPEICLQKIVWDEHEIFFETLDQKKSFLWCSAPLYTPSELISRRKIFTDFTQKHTPLSIKDILFFHSNTNPKETMLYNNGEKATVSITQIFTSDEKTQLNYYDLKNKIELF